MDVAWFLPKSLSVVDTIRTTNKIKPHQQKKHHTVFTMKSRILWFFIPLLWTFFVCTNPFVRGMYYSVDSFSTLTGTTTLYQLTYSPVTGNFYAIGSAGTPKLHTITSSGVASSASTSTGSGSRFCTYAGQLSSADYILTASTGSAKSIYVGAPSTSVASSLPIYGLKGLTSNCKC